MAYPNINFIENSHLEESFYSNYRPQLFNNSVELHGQDDDDEDVPGKPKTYTSQLAILFILINVTLGVGLLAMPYSMQQAGIITAIMTCLVFLIMVIVTCLVCVELTVKSGAKSYHEMVRMYCGPTVYRITQVSILLIVFGTTIAFIVTIGDQSDRLFATIYGDHFCKTWYLDRRFIMISSTLFLITPLCCLKTVDSLKYASFLGLIGVAFIAYVLMSEVTSLDRFPKSINYYPKSLGDITSMLPILCFGYACHLSLVPTVGNIRKSQKPMAFVTVTSMLIICTIVYLGVSMLAVFIFGDKIKSDLIENLPGKSWSTLATIALVGFKCILTLPAAFLPARLSLVDTLTNSCNMFADLSEPTKRVSVSVVTLILALLMALFVPNITVAVSLLGALSVMFVFNLPALAYLSLIDQNRCKKQQLIGLTVDKPVYSTKDQFKRFISYIMFIVGAILGSVALSESISNILHGTSSDEALCKV